MRCTRITVQLIVEARKEVATAKEEHRLAQQGRMDAVIALCRSDFELEQSQRRLAALDFEDLDPAGPGLEGENIGEPVVGVPVEEGVLV